MRLSAVDKILYLQTLLFGSKKMLSPTAAAGNSNKPLNKYPEKTIISK